MRICAERVTALLALFLAITSCHGKVLRASFKVVHRTREP